MKHSECEMHACNMRIETVKALKKIKRIFDMHNIVFWLDAGTLLGSVRNGEILEWDSDVDLGMWASDFEKVKDVFPVFKEEGFNAVMCRNKGRSILSVLSPQNRFYLINFDMYHKHGEFAWKLMFSERRYKLKSFMLTLVERLARFDNFRVTSEKSVSEKIKVFASKLPKKMRFFVRDVAWSFLLKIQCLMIHAFPSHHFETLDTISFYGETFNIPSDVEIFLSLRYGDWKTTKKNWCYYKQARERHPELLDTCIGKKNNVRT